jgi:hypothetical protein
MAMTTDVVPDMVKTFVAYFYRHIREKNGQPRSPPPRRRREIGSKISVWAGQDLDGYGDETVTPKHTADVLAVSRGALVGFTKRMVFPTSAADPEGGQHVYAGALQPHTCTGSCSSLSASCVYSVVDEGTR